MWSNTKHFTLTVVAFNRQDVCADAHTILGDFTSTVLLEVDLTEDKLSEVSPLPSPSKVVLISMVGGYQIAGKVATRPGTRKRQWR